MRIPYPIPDPERSKLIAAGKEAIRQKINSKAREEAGVIVRRVIAEVQLRYGMEEVK